MRREQWASTFDKLSFTRAFRVTSPRQTASIPTNDQPLRPPKMEYEKCYVFEPDTRQAKRRKIEPQGLQSSRKVRKQAYEKAWEKQKKVVDEILDATNANTIDELEDFLATSSHNAQDGRIPTAIISAGPDAGSHRSIAQQLQRKGAENGRRVFVSLSAPSATNLKAALKAIILKTTSQNEGLDEDEELHASGKGRKLLNYDLQILQDHVQERKLDQVILSIEDTEAFNSDLLSELIEVLGCWQDRIPFVLFFSIATSLEFLQQRLSRDAVKCLAGRMFDVAPAAEEIERVFDAITGPEASIWIGANLLGNVLERQSDYIQGIGSLVYAVQYAYMSCYYANALSVFLVPNIRFEDVPKDHFEAARNTQSFREHCRLLLDGGDAQSLQQLLDSDASVFALLRERISLGRKALRSIRSATLLIEGTLRHLQTQPQPSSSRLYLQAMSNKLQASSLLRSMLLSIRKAPSTTAVDLFDVATSEALPGDVREKAGVLQKELEELVGDRTDATQPLRSEDDVKNSTLRTTVVAQKVELSKQKSTLSKEDAAYTAILRRFTDLLEEYFADVLINPKDLVFHEIFLYDLKSPHREAFTPRPRHAVERALASPHDYLSCECCAPEQGDSEEATLSATQPATAILYQLYLESGSLINVSDLWQAFQAVVGDEKTEEENMALFQRALAELQYLGMVKSTRKRVDHVAKVAWRGL